MTEGSGGETTEKKEAKEYTVPDIMPGGIESVRLIDGDWDPIAERPYKYSADNGGTVEEGNSDSDGYIKEKGIVPGGKQVTLTPGESAEEGKDQEMPKVNPGPIPDDKLLELKNQSDGGKGPVKKMDNRKELVEHVQHMLIALGYDLGDYGPDKNGVDGDFGDATEKAVKDFQEKHKDWEGNALVVDGLVGPRTGNALNRALVGVWYEKYETPGDLTGDVKLVTLTRKMAESEGFSF